MVFWLLFLGQVAPSGRTFELLLPWSMSEGGGQGETSGKGRAWRMRGTDEKGKTQPMQPGLREDSKKRFSFGVPRSLHEGC